MGARTLAQRAFAGRGWRVDFSTSFSLKELETWKPGDAPGGRGALIVRYGSQQSWRWHAAPRWGKSGSIRECSPNGRPICPPIPPDKTQTAGNRRSRRSPAVARRTFTVYEFFVIGAFHACAVLGRSTVRTSSPASFVRTFASLLSAGFDRFDRSPQAR